MRIIVGAHQRHIDETEIDLPMQLESFISALPKSELHVHIEGCLEPELVLQLAEQRGVQLAWKTPSEFRKSCQFGCLQDFLDLYYRSITVLQKQEDFRALARSYLRKAHAQNVKYTEIFFDPQSHLSRGISFATLFEGLWEALVEAERSDGIRARLILCFLRHLDEDDALRTLDLALPYQDRILGVGLDSSELGHPPSKFRRVFDRAREAGFHLVAHAGEEGPPQYIWEALDVLGVERVDHGNRALEDDVLMKRLARDKMPLTMCPLCNVALRVIDDLRNHPLQRFLDAGVPASLHSDDPAYFGGYIHENYTSTAQALGLPAETMRDIARNGFQAAFLPPAEKQAALETLEAAAARALGSA